MMKIISEALVVTVYCGLWRNLPRAYLGYISPYILTKVIIQTLSISKNDTSSIVFPGWAIFVKLIFCIAMAAGFMFFIIHPAQLGEYWKIFAHMPEQYGKLT